MSRLALFLPAFLILMAGACRPAGDSSGRPEAESPSVPDRDFWNNATIYFLLTDRFHNGDTSNDLTMGRQADGAPLRYFLGGDLKGVTEKVREGYFSDLGVNALWTTPTFEQIKGSVDEGTGLSYGYHGYWIRDWTTLDPNFGSPGDLAELVQAAHEKDIRVVLDVVINHTGPVTELDSQWPDSWVRTGPRCNYTDLESFVSCTLVDNLPDIRTGKDEPVELPAFLLAKWEEEGRREQELAELDAFFERTGYPRAPRYYIIKWLTDYIRELGIDAFRMDTAKHFEKEVSEEVKKEAVWAYEDWKSRHPDRLLEERDFFLFGEVYGYGIDGGRFYDFGDRKVDFFNHGYNSLINFGFKEDALLPYEEHFHKYEAALSPDSVLGRVGLVNYLTSHDDAESFDRAREKPMEAAIRLLLSPGAAQIYYGDESARLLLADSAEGDAQLRTYMNWDQIRGNELVQGRYVRDILTHWQKLGRFRRQHMAVGAGEHRMRSASPYLFSRTYDRGGLEDRVLIGLGLEPGEQEIPVFDLFSEGSRVRDAYSGAITEVRDGELVFNTPFSIILLESVPEEG